MYLTVEAEPQRAGFGRRTGLAAHERHGTEGFKQKSERSCGVFPVVCAIAPACVSAVEQRLRRAVHGRGSWSECGRNLWRQYSLQENKHRYSISMAIAQMAGNSL